MRRREIKRHAVQGLRDSGMMGELFSSVRRKAFYRLPLQYLKQYRIDGLCCLFGCFASYQIPALSIYQRNQTGFSCLSCYGITFPMSSPGAVSGSCWPFRNIVRDGNRTPSFLILPGMPGFSMMPQAADRTAGPMGGRRFIKHTGIYGAVNRCIAKECLLMFQLQVAGKFFREPMMYQKEIFN